MLGNQATEMFYIFKIQDSRDPISLGNKEEKLTLHK